MADVRRLVELGMVPPLAKEVSSQITSGVGNARRLAELSMVPRLAAELAAQITSKVGNARRLAELTMVPVLAMEVAGQVGGGVVPPVSVSLDAPVPASMVAAGKLIEAYGQDRLVEGYSGNTLQGQNTDTSEIINLGFDPTTFAFNAAGLPSGSNLLSWTGQGGTGIPLSVVAGGVVALSRSGVVQRFGTTRDASEQLSRSPTLGGIGVNLAGAGVLATGNLPIDLAANGCEIHLLWSPNNRKLAQNDTTDPVPGGSTVRENLFCYGKDTNNQMTAYLAGGNFSDLGRLTAGGTNNQASNKGQYSSAYRYKAKAQHVTSYVMSSTGWQEIESGKVTKTVVNAAGSVTAVQGGALNNGIFAFGSNFASTSNSSLLTTNRLDGILGAVIITKALTDAERRQLQAKLAAIGQQHRAASVETVKGFFDEIVDHRDTNPATGRVVGKNGKLTTDYNIAGGLFSTGYSIPGVGASGMRSTSFAVGASYEATDNYFWDVIEGTVMRLSFWETNANNGNLAWDIGMGPASPQAAGPYSFLLGYHHTIPAVACKPSLTIDTLPRLGNRRKADLTLWGQDPVNNQSTMKYNFVVPHTPVIYNQTYDGYIWTKAACENTDPGQPYQFDAPIYMSVGDAAQYPFKPGQLQLHITTFSPDPSFDKASPDPNLFLSQRVNSYISGGGLDPIGHMDGSVARQIRAGVPLATSDHKIKSVQYQNAFQGTRCMWGFAKRQLTETEIETIQVNLYKLAS